MRLQRRKPPRMQAEQRRHKAPEGECACTD